MTAVKRKPTCQQSLRKLIRACSHLKYVEGGDMVMQEQYVNGMNRAIKMARESLKGKS